MGNENFRIESEDATPYQSKLRRIQKLLKTKHSDDYNDEVIYHLGNDISALRSVPTAIFCFLKAQKEISGIDVRIHSNMYRASNFSISQTDSVFRRTIQYAISLGGDTDTIASMAGSIVGAYLGEEAVNANLMKHCEFHKEIVEMADNLFKVSEEPPTAT